MEWVNQTIWWHVYPLGFVGAPIREDDPLGPGAHRLRRINAWLDYAVSLGASGLLFAPIFESSTHGYDSLDQFAIDSRLGTDEDFDDLVAECKKRGLRILLDGVFSHVGAENLEVKKALDRGPSSPQANFFDIDWERPEGPAPRVFEGHGALVRFNHSHPKTVEYVREVMRYWLNRGIDGWRLDAAYSVPTWFWAQVVTPLREEFPDAWFLGEVIHGDYPQFVLESSLDSVTQYWLWKAIWSSIKEGNFFELDWAIQANNGFLETFIPNTFIGNHDVTRIATTLSSQEALTAFAILMTIAGIPSVYYGDEQSFTGLKEENIAGDDAIRPEMPETPRDLLPFGEKSFHAHQGLIALRRRHPWLVTATTEALTVDNRQYTYRTTSTDGAHFLTVSIDLDAEIPVTITDDTDTVVWTQPKI